MLLSSSRSSFRQEQRQKSVDECRKTGMELADDVLEGRSLKESAKRRVPAGIKRTVRGLKFQSGSGVRHVKTNKKKRKIRGVFS